VTGLTVFSLQVPLGLATSTRQTWLGASYPQEEEKLLARVALCVGCPLVSAPTVASS